MVIDVIKFVESLKTFSSKKILYKFPFLLDEFSKLEKQIPINQFIYLYCNNITDIPCCKTCYNEVKFVSYKFGYRDYCSNKCVSLNIEVCDRKKKTNLEKYGVDNPSKSVIIKDKVKQTNRVNFGVDYPLQSNKVLLEVKNIMMDKYGVTNSSYLSNVINKRRNTSIKKYGVDNYNKSDKAKEIAKNLLLENPDIFNRKKFNETMIQRYGVDNYAKTEEYRIKSIKTNNEKYGVDSYTQSDQYKIQIKKFHINKIIETFNKHGYYDIYFDEELLSRSVFGIKCNKCLKYFETNKQLFNKRINSNQLPCTICNKLQKPRSVYEDEIHDYIKSLMINNLIKNYKLDRKELDIYLPEYNIGI